MSAAGIVAALAEIEGEFRSLAAAWRSVPVVRAVVTRVSPRRYEDGDRVECYLDASLANGNVVGLWLEFSLIQGSWVIESSIRHNTDVGEDELMSLPMRVACEDDELCAELHGAMKAITAAGAALDLTRL